MTKADDIVKQSHLRDKLWGIYQDIGANTPTGLMNGPARLERFITDLRNVADLLEDTLPVYN